MNFYPYCSNNPVSLRDPLGLSARPQNDGWESRFRNRFRQDSGYNGWLDYIGGLNDEFGGGGGSKGGSGGGRSGGSSGSGNGSGSRGGALLRLLAGSQYGAGVGGEVKGKLGPLKVEAGMHDISGKRITQDGIEDFYEEKAGVSGQLGPLKFSSEVVNGEGSFRPSWEFGSKSLKDSGTIEIGGTIPYFYSGAAINLELHINLGELRRR